MTKTSLIHLAAIAFIGTITPQAASTNELLTAVYVFEKESANAEPPMRLQWHLKRAQRCVEVSDSQAQVTERWNRDDHGRIWYQRIFHTEKKVIEYQPTDLVLGGVESGWARISQIIDPRELQQLAIKPGNEKFEGQSVLVYEGMRQGTQVQVRWLTEASIPERVVSTAKSGATSSLQLISIDRDDSQQKECHPPALHDYDSIDFSDIGDRHDPFLERLMRFEGFGHGHR